MKKKFLQKNMGRKVLSKAKGFTLVETLVAILIFSISILSILSILASSINDTTYAKNKIVVGYLAQEGIEYVRNMRDTYVLYTNPSSTGWTNFNNKLSSCTSSNTACGFDNSIAPGPSSNFSACGPSPSIACLLYLNNGNYNIINTGTSSGFTRKIWMTTTTNSDEVKIFSEVDYYQGSGTAKIIFSEDLFNWEP